MKVTINFEKLQNIIKYTVISIITLLLILSAASLVYYALDLSLQKVPVFITATSMFAIALLTLAYVITTSRQLSTMKNQLIEMKKSRELIEQPLPIVIPNKAFLERPRVYYSPPDHEYSGISRYHVECVVNNNGTSPAVSIHICSCLSAYNNGNREFFRSAPEYVDVLAEKSKIDTADLRAPSFTFVEDKAALVIDALRSQDPKKVPILRICTFYKNVLGAPFGCRQSFQLFRKDPDQESVLKNWQTQISGFTGTFKHEIDELRRIVEKNSEKWDELFNEIKETYATNIEEEDQEIRAIQIPGSFKIEAITDEQYQSIVSDARYGQFMILPDHCLADE